MVQERPCCGLATLPPGEPSRRPKFFLLGLTLIPIGGFLRGVGFILDALGSLEGNTSQVLGLPFLMARFVLALSRLD